MSYLIDFRTMPLNMPSLCIPRTFSNINEKMVYDTIVSLQMGQINKVEVIPQMNAKGEKYNKIFIHFDYWFNNENAYKAREYVMTGKELKIMYRDPWFWKVSALRLINPKTIHKSNHLKIYNNNINNNNNKKYLVKKSKEELDKDLDDFQLEQDKLCNKNNYNKEMKIIKEDEEIIEKDEIQIQIQNKNSEEEIISINYGKITFPKKKHLTKNKNKQELVIDSII